MRFTSVRQAAAQYIQEGYRVVPLYGATELGCRCGNPACKPRDAGKHEPPETEGQWKDGRTFTPEDFTEEMGIALGLGPWGGDGWLLAFDLDYSTDLSVMFPEVGMPPTLTQRTKRGAHFVYKVPAFTPLGNWNDALGTKDKRNPEAVTVDLRYARGRIVTSPARGYEWTSWTQPVPLPPRAIFKILAVRRRKGLPVQQRWSRDGKAP